MTRSFDSRPPRFAWWQRTALVIAGSGAVALLFLATQLQPASAGLGTHQQLGLPACWFRVELGTRCPACGMTTAWTHFVRGQWVRASRANLGGALLALLASVAGPWAIGSGWRGRPWGGMPPEWLALPVGITIVTVTLAQWVGRLLFSYWS